MNTLWVGLGGALGLATGVLGGFTTVGGLAAGLAGWAIGRTL